MQATKKPTPISMEAVVIGTSSGGLRALAVLVLQFQPDFPLPIFIVQHISEDASGTVLLDSLRAARNMHCKHAESGEQPKPGHIYLAPSGHHLLINEELKIVVSKGAHENRARPSIDALFRSAAVAYGNKLIAIILTGYLNDGSSGMEVIKKCGGICIVQDPDDAEYPQMPQHAIDAVEVDHIMKLEEMGGLIYSLISRKMPKSNSIPKEIVIEAAIAQRVLSDLPAVDTLGTQVPFNCPGCGGNLWIIGKSKTVRSGAMLANAYTAEVLIAEQASKIEETMWTALRMFEERKTF